MYSTTYFTCSILFTLIATISAKSIGIGNNEDIESSTIDSTNTLPSHPPINQDVDSVSKFGNKRSLPTLQPTIAGKENAECKSLKSKRCRTSSAKGRLSPLLGAKNPLKPDTRHSEDSASETSDTETVSLRRPAAVVPVSISVAKNITFLDEDLLDSLRKQLMSNNPTVGATQNSPKTSVIDDDNFVCYCMQKSNPSPKKATNRNAFSKPQSPPLKGKAERRPEIRYNKSRPKSGYADIPYKSSSNKYPAFYPDASYYPSYVPNSMYPALAQKGRGTPYIPYLRYPPDPRVAVASINENWIPTKTNKVAGKPDSIVGQRAPIIIGQRHNLNNEATVGQAACPTNTIGRSRSQSAPKTIAVTSKALVEEDTRNDEGGDDSKSLVEKGGDVIDNEETNSAGSDYNLQSVHAEYGDKNNSAASPGIRGSNRNAADEFEYGTTGNGIVDYTDVEEVTTAYFTSKAYANETGHTASGYVDSPIAGTVPMNTDPQEDQKYNVNLLNRSSRPSARRSQEVGATSAERLNDANPSTGRANERRNDLVGEGNPYCGPGECANDGNSDEEDTDNYETKESSAIQTDELIRHDSTFALDEDTSAKIDDKGESSATDYAKERPETEDNAGPLGSDYAGENFGSDKSGVGEKMSGERDCSAGKGRIYPADSANDYAATGGDPVNRNNDGERVAAIGKGNEDDSGDESTVKSSRDWARDPSKQPVPFCDNALLQKSIKAAINKFASGDSSETEETVAAAKGEDLLPEIVRVPNLKGVLSVPAIERTIVDRTKKLLSNVTGMTRKSLDSDWVTDVIRSNLRNIMSAAPDVKTELPPMAVEEHQFRNGKWVTNVVTLQPPTGEESRVPTDLERLRGHVKSILRHPAINSRAAKNPAVRNMIVASVRNSFEPRYENGDQAFDASLIRSTLNEQVNAIEAEEEEEIATTEDASATTAFDVSDIDMNKFLDIAKSEAGLDGKSESASSTSKSLSSEKIVGDARNTEEIIAVTSVSLDECSAGAERDAGSSVSNVYPTVGSNWENAELAEENGDAEVGEKPEESEATTLSSEKVAEQPKYNSISGETSRKLDAGTAKNQGESSTALVEEYAFAENSSPTMDSTENADAIVGENAESAERTANTRSSTEFYADDTFATQDLAYLGKITLRNEDKTEDARSLRDSELFYIGNGVKLPLEIRKLKDGSYALSISRKICEHLLNEECPCCVPLKGNVVRTVKRNADRTTRTQGSKRGRRISKRESAKSILPNDGGMRDSADDSLQIFSMPVESFARRYNLSLNLEKVQTPWNFDATKGKIDARPIDRGIDLKNTGQKYAGARKLRTDETKRIKDDSGVDHDATNYEYDTRKEKNLEKYRYQRNANESGNKRVELIKNVLNWLRDVILNSNADR